MYAIQNRETKKWLYGTDYRFAEPRQRTSREQMMVYATLEQAKADMVARKCNKYYRIMELTKVTARPVKESE